MQQSGSTFWLVNATLADTADLADAEWTASAEAISAINGSEWSKCYFDVLFSASPAIVAAFVVSCVSLLTQGADSFSNWL